MRGDATGGQEILAAELIRDSDYGSSHGTVFVGSLSPRELFGDVNPDRETHYLDTHYFEVAARVKRSSTPAHSGVSGGGSREIQS